MTLHSIPCLFMRGGTSKGPFFLADDLPSDIAARDFTLLAVMGSPDVRQIDGLGGADTLTSKVAIVSRSERPGIDVDYLFAQVAVDKPVVDTAPSCGNMLAGIAPFAIERGLVETTGSETRVMIYNVNTGSVIESVVQTEGKNVVYEGTAQIDGVPGNAAPIFLNFTDIVGSKTGNLLPTGNSIDVFDGIEATCIDVAMPMVLLRATDFGLDGAESREALEQSAALFERLECIRLMAAEKMGLGDVRQSVIPKIGLLLPPTNGGDICSRYLTPWKVHAAHAVTGAICVASAAALNGTIAYELAKPSNANPRDIVVEHLSGKINVRLETGMDDGNLTIVRAGTVRTSRLIMRGEVLVPEIKAQEISFKPNEAKGRLVPPAAK